MVRLERSMCRRCGTKTKVITAANHDQEQYLKAPMRAISWNMWTAWSAGNLNDQGAIGFSFPSDWLWEGCGYLDQSHRKVMQKWLSIPGHFRYSIGHFTVFSIFYIYVHLYFFFLSYQHVMYLRELRLAQMERLMAEFLYGVDIYLSIARDSKELNPKVTRKYAIFF